MIFCPEDSDNNYLQSQNAAYGLLGMVSRANKSYFPVSRWRKEEITNFEYLTELNKTAGRSFNDLMQYPVFPFVLRDFRSDVLDLNNNSSFRYLIYSSES